MPDGSNVFTMAPVARVGIDMERHVAHTESGMSARLAVRGGTAPVLLQEKKESFLCGAEILLGIHRLQHRIECHLAVEHRHDLRERLAAADLVVERHFCGLPSSSFAFARALMTSRTTSASPSIASRPQSSGFSMMRVRHLGSFAIPWAVS